MAALELVTGFTTAAGTTFTGLTMAAGNTLTVRNAPQGADIRLLQAWSDHQAAGAFRIHSPSFHDNVQGIRLNAVTGDLSPLLPWGCWQPLFPQDTMVVESTGSATSGDIETICMLIYYDQLPGADAQLYRWSEIAPYIANIVTVENTLSLGTAGGYSGEEAIDVEFDLLKANTHYALLGYLTQTECAAIRWRGADVGNYGVGGPGENGLRFLTKDWFKLLSDAFDLPLIPVFNAANKSGVLIDGAQDENGADPTVTQIFAELEGWSGSGYAQTPGRTPRPYATQSPGV